MPLVTSPIEENFTEPATRVLGRVIEYLPNLFGALTLILIGLVAAYLLRAIGRRLTRYALGRLKRGTPTDVKVEEQPLYQSLPGIIGGIVFWIVLLFFLAAGVEALGLEAVSGLFSSVTIYLPRVLAVAIIVFAGLFLGDYARIWVTRAATKTGSAFAETLGRGAQATIWLIVILVSIEQLGINSTGIIIVLAIAGGSLFGAGALAFGLGARTTVGNIIAAHYVHKTYRVGDSVKIGERQGRIVEISRVAVVLETPDGRVLVPASRFNEEVSMLVEEDS